MTGCVLWKTNCDCVKKYVDYEVFVGWLEGHVACKITMPLTSKGYPSKQMEEETKSNRLIKVCKENGR